MPSVLDDVEVRRVSRPRQNRHSLELEEALGVLCIVNRSAVLLEDHFVHLGTMVKTRVTERVIKDCDVVDCIDVVSDSMKAPHPPWAQAPPNHNRSSAVLDNLGDIPGQELFSRASTAIHLSIRAKEVELGLIGEDDLLPLLEAPICNGSSPVESVLDCFIGKVGLLASDTAKEAFFAECKSDCRRGDMWAEPLVDVTSIACLAGLDPVNHLAAVLV